MTLDRDRDRDRDRSPKRGPERKWVIPVIVAGAVAVLAFALGILVVTGQSLF